MNHVRPNSLQPRILRFTTSPSGVVALLAALGGITFCLVSTLSPGAAHAQSNPSVPATIPVQGYLTDSNGDPVDGSVTMRFRLYDSPADENEGGTLLYEEIQDQRTVEQGLFNEQLGAGTSTDAGTSSELTPILFRNHQFVFLEIEVAGETLSPRKRLATAPYAAYAEHAVSAARANVADNAEQIDGVSGSNVYSTQNQPSIDDLPGGYTGANGVSVDNNSNTIGLSTCPNDGEVLQWSSASGTWECAARQAADNTCSTGVSVGLDANRNLVCQQVESADVGANQIGATQADTASIASEYGTCSTLELLKGFDSTGSKVCKALNTNDFQLSSSSDVELASNSVGNDELATDAVNSSSIDDNTVAQTDLASDSVGNSELQTDAVSDDKIDYGCGSEYLELRGCAGYDLQTALNGNFPTCDSVGVGVVCKEGSASCPSNNTTYDQNGNSGPCESGVGGTGSVQLYVKSAP